MNGKLIITVIAFGVTVGLIYKYISDSDKQRARLKAGSGSEQDEAQERRDEFGFSNQGSSLDDVEEIYAIPPDKL